jgi:hypothetical protein
MRCILLEVVATADGRAAKGPTHGMLFRGSATSAWMRGAAGLPAVAA